MAEMDVPHPTRNPRLPLHHEPDLRAVLGSRPTGNIDAAGSRPVEGRVGTLLKLTPDANAIFI